MDIVVWLRSLGLGKYEAAFRENSAGQAAVFLAKYASKVRMLIRSRGLAASMSRHLIDRISATPSIELHPTTDVTQLTGDWGAGLHPSLGVTRAQVSRQQAKCGTFLCSSGPAGEACNASRYGDGARVCVTGKETSEQRATTLHAVPNGLRCRSQQDFVLRQRVEAGGSDVLKDWKI